MNCLSSAEKKAILGELKKRGFAYLPSGAQLKECGLISLRTKIGSIGYQKTAKLLGIPSRQQWLNDHPQERPNSTLCWVCKHAVPNPQRGTGCSWSIDFKPVPGWKAKKVVVDRIGGSFLVEECPRFEDDGYGV